jgi:hypothetical protein
MYYTFNDYENISIDNYIMDQSILDNLTALEGILNLNVEKKEHNYERKSKSWNQAKSFQKTIFVQNVSEEDKIYNEIRNSLNKLSANNYEVQSINIVNNVEKCEDKTKVMETIYNVACSNKVFSELYAKLYKQLCEKYDCFYDNVSSMLEKYKTDLANIVYKDPNVEYDDYCVYTKNNDKLRSSLTFYVNLFKYDLMKRNDLVDLIIFLLDNMDTNKTNIDHRNEMDEYVEQLFVLCKNMNLCLCEKFDEIKSRLEVFSNLKNGGEIVSMSSRVNFRCMDILDTLK